MTIAHFTNRGKRTAILSFLCGTLIIVLYYLTSNFILLVVGLILIPLVALINIGVLNYIIGKTEHFEDRKKLYKIYILMLLNIPITIFYCWFAIILMDTMRITFINSTTKKLTNLKIIGCESKYIEKLEPYQLKPFGLK